MINTRPRRGEPVGRITLGGNQLPVVLSEVFERFFDDLAALPVPEVVDVEDEELTVSPGHNGQFMRMTAAGAKTVTLPAEFTPKTKMFSCEFTQESATQIGFALENPAHVIRSRSSLTHTLNQNSLVRLVWLEPGVWGLFGDLG